MFVSGAVTVYLGLASLDGGGGRRPVCHVASRLHDVLHRPNNPTFLPHVLGLRVHLQQPLQYLFVPGVGPSGPGNGRRQSLVHGRYRDLCAPGVRRVVDGPSVRVAVLGAQNSQAVLDFRPEYKPFDVLLLGPGVEEHRYVRKRLGIEWRGRDERQQVRVRLELLVRVLGVIQRRLSDVRERLELHVRLATPVVGLEEGVRYLHVPLWRLDRLGVRRVQRRPPLGWQHQPGGAHAVLGVGLARGGDWPFSSLERGLSHCTQFTVRRRTGSGPRGTAAAGRVTGGHRHRRRRTGTTRLRSDDAVADVEQRPDHRVFAVHAPLNQVRGHVHRRYVHGRRVARRQTGTVNAAGHAGRVWIRYQVTRRHCLLGGERPVTGPDRRLRYVLQYGKSVHAEHGPAAGVVVVVVIVSAAQLLLLLLPVIARTATDGVSDEETSVRVVKMHLDWSHKTCQQQFIDYYKLQITSSYKFCKVWRVKQTGETDRA
ncbi:hypothetical protein AGLY_001448 [Aphis glycines]|uniref:Uncharacterized protein n=1 Tax=Aphis glycines TaxID=307491 RepID=A0A6G0U6M7_APHGL|nr:hypothetical protein AGLY_001448 [Aphis glycines]